MALMKMHHDTDPGEELLEKIGNIENVTVTHNQILIATYKRPEKTKSGIILADQTRKEDEYQGKVGYVLKTGPGAFVDEGSVNFYGQHVYPGEWVVFRYSDGLPLEINGVHCRLLEDAHIKLIVPAPDMVR